MPESNHFEVVRSVVLAGILLPPIEQEPSSQQGFRSNDARSDIWRLQHECRSMVCAKHMQVFAHACPAMAITNNSAASLLKVMPQTVCKYGLD